MAGVRTHPFLSFFVSSIFFFLSFSFLFLLLSASHDQPSLLIHTRSSFIRPYSSLSCDLVVSCFLVIPFSQCRYLSR